MSVFISHCGSPVVLVEKLLSGTETSTALKGMIKLLSSGVLDKTNDFGRKSDGGLEVKQFAKYPGVYEATGLENMKSLKNSDIPLVIMYLIVNYNTYVIRNYRIEELLH